MRSSLSRIPKPAFFAYLMLFSVILLLVPASWKSWMRGVVQPVGWIEAVFSPAARGARDGAERVTRPRPTAEDTQRLAAENEELRRQLAAASVHARDLAGMLEDVSGIRDQLGNDSAKILFGTVIGGSPTPRRETLTIWPGSSHGVKSGDWVAAGLPEELRDETATGRELVMRQWLIGRVTDVQPYRSTVRLVTDVEFTPPVRVVAARRLADGRWQRSEREGLLYGVGNGKMQIRSSTADWAGQGYSMALAILPGQTPIALAVGRITGSRRLPEAALYFNIDVEPPGDARRLANVYVISLGP